MFYLFVWLAIHYSVNFCHLAFINLMLISTITLPVLVAPFCHLLGVFSCLKNGTDDDKNYIIQTIILLKITMISKGLQT